MSVIAFSPAIGPVSLNVILREKHRSEIEITSNPIEDGSEVNDHAYIVPKNVVLDVADSGGAATYDALVRFQESRVPFSLVTGFRVYRNMLVRSIEGERDSKKAFIFSGSVELQEVIIVGTAYATGLDGSADGGATSTKGDVRTRQATPNGSIANGATRDTVAGTVGRGDSPASAVDAGSVTNQSILKSVFN